MLNSVGKSAEMKSHTDYFTAFDVKTLIAYIFKYYMSDIKNKTIFLLYIIYVLSKRIRSCFMLFFYPGKGILDVDADFFLLPLQKSLVSGTTYLEGRRNQISRRIWARPSGSTG